MFEPNRLVWMSAVLVTFGCGADTPAGDSHTPERGRDAGRDASAADASALDATLAEDAAQDAAVVRNDSFDTALPIDLESANRLHDVTRSAEVDYFSFQGQADAFYAVSTDQHLFSPDTVIALFDSDEQPLGENDSGSIWPGDNYDSRLVVRLQHAGTYYVRVQNHLGNSPITPPVYYHLKIEQLMPGADGVALQKTASAAEVHFAHDDMTGYAYATLLGDFAVVHAAAFTLDGQSDQVLVGHVLPSGAQGNGSTAHFGVVQVTGTDDMLISRIDVREQQESFHPPLAKASYRIDANLDGVAGKNGFFAIDLVTLDDNPPELAEKDNGELAGAETVELKQGMFSRRGLLLAHLAQGDVDYYRFESPNASVITVDCEGQSGGSGVLGLHAELRDKDDQMLAAADETPGANLLISAAMLADPGTYYLRLSSKTKTITDPVEPWARCALIARP
jgi:hypothetical protein